MIIFEPAASPFYIRLRKTIINAPGKGRGVNREGDGDGQFHQAFGAPRISGSGGGWDISAPLYRQCSGLNRGGVVGAGLRPGRGRSVQKSRRRKLRAQGVRNVYGLGLNVTTNGGDPNNVFNYFLIAYGGEGVVSKDGKLHLDDPQVKEAVIKALTYPATAYKEGFVPPRAINWH